MGDLTRALAEALSAVREAIGGATGVEAAQLAVTHLRKVAGEAVFPSIYRLEAGRLWLVAQAGYTGVFDGISLERGIMARAARTGRVQFVTRAEDEPEFLFAQPGFVSEITVPHHGHLVNVETTEPLGETVVPGFDELARFVIERLEEEPDAGRVKVSITRALGPMVGLASPELIAEYACRLAAHHLELSVAQLVMTWPERPPLSVFWRRPGMESGPLPVDVVMETVAARQAYVSWMGDRPAGFRHWPGLAEVVVLPIFRRGELCGGLVGAAPLIEPQLEAEALAAIAAHTSACLDRAALEDELSEALASRGDFIAAISHELRTPLTAIVGYSDLYMAGAAVSPAEASEFVTAIRDNASHVLELVSDILDVARADAGKLAVRVDEEVDLAAAAAGVQPTLAALAPPEEQAVEIEVPAGLIVRGEEVRVRQILLNLVSNALKFGGGRDVSVRGRAESGMAVIEVVDRGAGIDPGELATLFRPFSGRSRRDSQAGAGLGLVISRGLAEAMGGSLELRSAGSGRGATAVLRLPLLAADV